MKKIAFLVGLLAAVVLRADNTVVYLNANAPASGIPQTCVSLGLALNCTVTQIQSAPGGCVTVTCSPDWNPTPTQISNLIALLNAGQAKP